MWRITADALDAHGGRTALEGVRPAMSYRTLAARARAVAEALDAAGVRPGDRVALVSSHRAHDEPVALAGILAAGAVAVPLEASSPALRNLALLRSSDSRALLHDDPTLPLVASPDLALPRVQLDPDGVLLAHLPASAPARRASLAAPAGARTPDSSPSLAHTSTAASTAGGDTAREGDLACVLHTSGSTGTPKAVPIGWRAHDAFVAWMVALTDLGAGDRILRAAELSFDLAWFDHLAAWRAGATLCTVSRRETAAAGSLLAAVNRLAPTVIYGVPSFLAKLTAALAPDALLHPALRVICFAGEVYPPRQLAELARRAPDARLFNLYGPTETNVCTYHAVDRGSLDGTSELPIGKPCPYADCRLVDEQGRVIEGPGEGELHVRGPTALDGEHATRDCVERRADGLFYFRGRMDRVVKIRGYRVDPTEVEHALLECPEVREAAVIVRVHDRLGPELAGYVAASSTEVDPRQLRQRLAERLPPHLVPRTVAIVTELPRTATGKIDYRALAS